VSPDAHFGIIIIELDEDMLLCAILGCMLTMNMLVAMSNPAAKLFKSISLKELRCAKGYSALR
jgi:hypothetical protein